MAKKTSKPIHIGISKEEYERSMAEYAAAEAREQSIKAKMEAEMNKVRAKYAEQLEDLAAAKEVHFQVVEQYACEHRDVLFKDKKKVEGMYGTIGFRTGSPKLKLIAGFSWPDVTERCREFLPDYIKTSYDLAKSKLLADRSKEEVASQFEKVGVQVVQEETFYLDPK